MNVVAASRSNEITRKKSNRNPLRQGYAGQEGAKAAKGTRRKSGMKRGGAEVAEEFAER